jgi:fatty-acid desaturase
MTRTERTANLVGVVVPFVGLLIAIGLLWDRAVDGIDLAILAVMYMLTAVGVTVGFHRLLTHRAFRTHPWLERTFAVLGSLSVQGSVMDWVADHRKHGLWGLWHAHAFPRSAYHGLRRWEIDHSGLIISALARVGLAWEVVRVSPERQRQKALSGSSLARAR